MALVSPICWRCLTRRTKPARLPNTAPSRIALPRTASTNFSTTSSALAAAKKGAGGGRTQFGGPPKRGVKALNLGKFAKKDLNKGRPPAPGERKAIKKRIVLSNTNAFEVDDLKDWTPENIANHELLGRVVGFPGTVVDSLRAVEAFKPEQAWGFFRRPATLVTNECAALARDIQDIDSLGEKKTVRKMIIGERGTGKSVLLLQAMAMAFLKEWVVIHIPDAQALTIAHTEYEPLEGTSPTQYVQKTYTAALLARISKANNAILSALTTTQSHRFPIPLQPNISLSRLCDLGARDPELAWPAFLALWAELTSFAPAKSAAPNTTAPRRPPILLALDGLAHVSRLSNYLAPSMHHIHAHDLALVDHFMRSLSPAAAPLPNGGLVLAADSMSNRPACAALDLAIQRSTAAGEAYEAAPLQQQQWPLYDSEAPYAPVDPRALAALQGVECVQARGVDRGFARRLLEYYAASGVFRHKVTDGLVGEQWAVAGGGVVGELERAAVRYAF